MSMSEQWEKIINNPELMKEYNAKLAYHGGYVESKSNTLNCIDRTSFYRDTICSINFVQNANVPIR